MAPRTSHRAGPDAVRIIIGSRGHHRTAREITASTVRLRFDLWISGRWQQVHLAEITHKQTGPLNFLSSCISIRARHPGGFASPG